MVVTLSPCLSSSPFICFPSWSLFWAALGCRCRLVSLHMSPFLMSILGCSWLPLPLRLPSFVSLHDLHSGLLLAAAAALSPFICPPSWSPFWPAVGCGCRLVSLHKSPFIAFHVSPSVGSCVRLRASPFIAFHLSPSFFGNAIWGLCRCNGYVCWHMLAKDPPNQQKGVRWYAVPITSVKALGGSLKEKCKYNR